TSGRSHVLVARTNPTRSPTIVPHVTSPTSESTAPSPFTNRYVSTATLSAESSSAIPIRCGCRSPNRNDHAGNSVMSLVPGTTRLTDHQSYGIPPRRCRHASRADATFTVANARPPATTRLTGRTMQAELRRPPPPTRPAPPALANTPHNV